MNRIQWADDDSTIYSNDERPMDAILDMFDSGSERGPNKQAKINKDVSNTDSGVKAGTVMPFHVRVQHELAAYAKVVDAQKKKKV